MIYYTKPVSSSLTNLCIPVVIILFGVTGSGKTTIGTLLAKQLNWQFYDADDFHSTTNVEKMRQGMPLTDADRQPWLESLRQLIQTCVDQHEHAVLACSALRESYRQVLQVAGETQFVYLKGDFALIQERLKNRHGHYMNPALLTSQFAALEEPDASICIVDISPTPSEIVQTIRERLKV